MSEGPFDFNLSSIGAEPLEADDPRRIGAFPIRAVLGSGGMGRVYLGVAPEGYTAVKRVLPYLSNDKAFSRHFGQELDNQARLPSGVSTRLLAADRTARPPWFATEYVPGVTLHEAVYLNGGSLPIETAWVVLHELAVRLKAVAALEMVHRDLKPSNVMLTSAGLTLIDFGLARAADQSTLTATGMVVGTPAYMAPEQARAVKTLTPAVDVFSLGGLIAFVTTGEPPFGVTSGADQLFRIVHEPPDLAALRALDGELAHVVESCLAKDPLDRPSAAELLLIAGPHAKAGPPQWPASVAGQIAIRADFAAGRRPIEEADGWFTELEESVPDVEIVAEQDIPVAGGLAADGLAAGAPADDGAPRVSAHAASVPPVPESPPDSPKRTVPSSRRAILLTLALLLLAGGTGTLIAMHELPFVESTGTNGGNGQALDAGSQSSAATRATASAQASNSPTAKASGSLAASGGPARSSSSSATSGSGSGTKTSATTGATSVKTSTGTSSGSGGSSGGGSGSGSDPTVVSTTYSEIKNVGSSMCVSGGAGTGAQGCDGASDTAFKEVAVSGGFELVNESTGLCLLNNEAEAGDAYAFSCEWNASIQTWTVGTRTSRGGELMNSGECLIYSSTAQGRLAMAACDSSNSDELWYDGGA